MIVHMKQKTTYKHITWQAINNELVFCNIDNYYLGKLYEKIIFNFFDESSYDLIYNPNSVKNYKNIYEKHAFFAFNGEDYVGRIYKQILNSPHKIEIQKMRYVFELSEKLYYAYDIAKGRKGHTLFIYEDEKAVAAITHPRTIVNYKDEYELYIDESCIDPKMVILLCIFWDVMEFESGDAQFASGPTIRTRIDWTIPKEIRERYDPEFIKRIKAMDGLVD